MTIWDDFIIKALAEETQRFEPMLPIEFGSDLSCGDDIDSLATELAGDSPRLVIQAIYRRLITPRGGLLDDPDYGLDLHEFLELAMVPAQLATIPGRVQVEVLKDDRVQACTVEVTHATAERLGVRISLTLADGPHAFAVAVTPGSSALEELEQ